MLTVINLWAGPGADKSTIASDLFSYMKWRNMSVELVNEYAKELTWEGRLTTLSDQLYLLAKQNRKQDRLRNKVQYAIADSPILMGLAYVPANYYKHFSLMIRDVWDTYNNINFFINRVKPYHQTGRNQNEQEARLLDGTIQNILEDNKLHYDIVNGDEFAKLHIFNNLPENQVEQMNKYIDFINENPTFGNEYDGLAEKALKFVGELDTGKVNE